MNYQASKIVFLHIPKSAGTSIRRSLVHYFGSEYVFWIGQDCPSNTIFFPSSKIGNKPIIGGHKGISFYPKSLDALYLAVVREPVERVVSLFAYYTRPELAQAPQAVKERQKQLERWLKKGLIPDDLYLSIKKCKAFRNEISNQQCRFLSRKGRTFQGVLDSLNQYEFLVGRSDNLSLFQEGLQRISKVPNFDILRINNSSTDYSESLGLGADTIDLIKELNVEDTKLYNYIGASGGILDTVKRPYKYRDMVVVNRQASKVSTQGTKMNKMQEAEKIWPRGNNNRLRWPISSFMFSEAHKVLYVPIAKCGCTSLKSLMVDLAEVDQKDKLNKLGVHFITDRFNSGVQLKDIPIGRAKAILEDEDYFKFVVIREPYERLVSAYLEKFVFNRMSEANILHTSKVISLVRNKESVDFNIGITFREFVTTIVKQSPELLDTHWIPQSHYLRDIATDLHVFRVDQMGLLEEKLSALSGKDVSIEHKNKTSSSDKKDVIEGADYTIVDSYPEEIVLLDRVKADNFKSPDLVEVVERFYAEDYELLQWTSTNLRPKKAVAHVKPRPIENSRPLFAPEYPWADVHLFTKGGLKVDPGEDTYAILIIDNASKVELGGIETGPLHIGYRVKSNDGELLPYRAPQLPLQVTLEPGSKTTINVPVRIPPKIYNEAAILEFSLIVKGKYWVDSKSILHVCWLRIFKEKADGKWFKI